MQPGILSGYIVDVKIADALVHDLANLLSFRNDSSRWRYYKEVLVYEKNEEIILMTGFWWKGVIQTGVS